MSKKTTLIILIAIASSVVFPNVVNAALNLNVDYPAIPMPGGSYDLACIELNPTNEPRCQPTVGNVILFLYGAALWIGGIAAFITLVYTGFTFVLSGQSPSMREQSKGRMQNVLWGIGILLLSVVVLNLINPDIASLRDPTLAGVDAGERGDLTIPETGTEQESAQTAIAQCNNNFDTDGEIRACFEDAANEYAIEIVPTACATILDDQSLRQECVARCMQNSEMSNFTEDIRRSACESAADEAYGTETPPPPPPSPPDTFEDGQLNDLESACTNITGGTFVRDDVQCYFADEDQFFSRILTTGGFSDVCEDVGGTCQECDDPPSPTSGQDGRPAAYCRE